MAKPKAEPAPEAPVSDRPTALLAAAMLEDMDTALLDVAKLAAKRPDHPLASEIVDRAFKARQNCAASLVARSLRNSA